MAIYMAETTVVKEVATSISCDSCGLTVELYEEDSPVVNVDDTLESQEFFSINQTCGFGSIIGDGKTVKLDLCQKCFVDRLGDIAVVTDL
ncbi:hypothetical protein VCHA53O466_50519 [Vibrio chagasii]|nr:hypothetical protein VCHA53O466_50519 [Vibrio chagasii]